MNFKSMVLVIMMNYTWKLRSYLRMYNRNKMNN